MNTGRELNKLLTEANRRVERTQSILNSYQQLLDNLAQLQSNYTTHLLNTNLLVLDININWLRQLVPKVRNHLLELTIVRNRFQDWLRIRSRITR